MARGIGIKTRVALIRYKDAYRSYYNRDPNNINVNRGWIYLSGIYGPAIRATELDRMTDRLIQRRRTRDQGVDRAEELQRQVQQAVKIHDHLEKKLPFVLESVWDVRKELREELTKKINTVTQKIVDELPDGIGPKPFNWKNHINKDLIVMFLNRLYRECGSSPFDLERCMKDFALSGNFSHGLTQVDCDNCDTIQEILEEQEDRLNELKDKMSSLKHQYDMEKAISQKQKVLLKEMEEKLKNIKDNSILFTMDNIDMRNTKEIYEDDIPF